MSFSNYYYLCEYLRQYGRPAVQSRFGTTVELIGGDISLTFNAGDIPDRPHMSLQVCWCELVQLIAGQFDPTLFKRLAPTAKQSLFTREMAYGPRIWEFVPRVIQELKDNPYSREAVLYVGRAYQTCTPSEPCTSIIQFFVRDHKLITTVSMRSLDVIKGLPPDMVMFGGLAQAVANCLAIPVSTVTIQATGSAHIYYDDIEAGKLPKGGAAGQRERHFDMPKFSTWPEYVSWATDLMHTLWQGVPEGIVCSSH